MCCFWTRKARCACAKPARTPELEEERRAHVKDGAALCRFLYWLKHRVGKEPITECSAAEKLEQLRFLENGVPIRVVRVEGYEAHGVDTPEDLETIRELLAEHTCKSCVR